MRRINSDQYNIVETLYIEMNCQKVNLCTSGETYLTSHGAHSRPMNNDWLCSIDGTGRKTLINSRLINGHAGHGDFNNAVSSIEHKLVWLAAFHSPFINYIIICSTYYIDVLIINYHVCCCCHSLPNSHLHFLYCYYHLYVFHRIFPFTNFILE